MNRALVGTNLGVATLHRSVLSYGLRRSGCRHCLAKGDLAFRSSLVSPQLDAACKESVPYVATALQRRRPAIIASSCFVALPRRSTPSLWLRGRCCAGGFQFDGKGTSVRRFSSGPSGGSGHAEDASASAEAEGPASDGGGSSGSRSSGGASLRPRTFYDVLEVSRRANKDEIKEAYRKLAKKWHPDRNIDDEEAENRFKEVQEAHTTLSDTWKRALYDQDLQFGKYGSQATQDVEKEAWTEHWSKETPEEREARKERYKRYAAGERNDLPPDPFPVRWTPVIFAVIIGTIYYVCIRAPDWFDLQSDPTFCDPAYNDRADPLVRAFHDPVLSRWERLPEGTEPPSPAALYEHYRRVRPDLMETVDLRLLPKLALTTLMVPRTEARKAMARDLVATASVGA